MGGTTSQNTQQQSQTQPYAPAQPMLQSILNQLGGVSMNPTAGQTTAVNTIGSEAAGTPSFATPGINAVNGMFNTSTTPQQGTLNTAYNTSAGALAPMLDPSWMNPATNPYLGTALSTANQDITSQIADQFAAAGRPLGTNAAGTQALARGLSQGDASILSNEFNTLAGQTAGAAQELPGIATSVTGALTGQQQAPLTMDLSGIQAAGAIPGLETQPGTTALTAASLAQELPYMNVQSLEGLTVPIAGLGAQSQGTSTTSTTAPWYTTALGAGLLGASLFPSDERIKEDIAPVGMLFDGTPVHSFRFKGGSKKQIGVMAQDVEKRRPDAVHEMGGVKMVDYGKATEHSRNLGMLDHFKMAA